MRVFTANNWGVYIDGKGAMIDFCTMWANWSSDTYSNIGFGITLFNFSIGIEWEVKK
jgi:hypothetical protein